MFSRMEMGKLECSLLSVWAYDLGSGLFKEKAHIYNRQRDWI